MNKQCYQKPNPSDWQGRKTLPGAGIQYWHQAVVLADLQHEPLPELDLAMLGYACDEGVRRNQGRTGAIEGPARIRQQLGKMAFHLGQKRLADFGDIKAAQERMELAQETFSMAIHRLLDAQIFPIGLGGGHDMAYANARGILEHLSQRDPAARLGIINLDAHFDLRPVQEQPNSGTPFNQLISEYGERVAYFPIGIQEAANPPQLFELARDWGIDFIRAEDCSAHHWPQVSGQLYSFIEAQDYLYLTIDLDGFSAAFAPGVSAPSVMGFSPDFAIQVLSLLTASKKLISCDLAELNPLYDRDQQTAQLAARLINKISLSL